MVEAGHHVAAVVIAQGPADKSRRGRELEIAQVAQAHNIPIISPAKPEQASDQLAALKADVGVLVAYGNLVSASVINLFPAGIINIHPSLLPLHRGSTPIESVILEGEGQTGVSLMQLVEAMDAGPIYDQQKVALSGSETKQELADKLAAIGSELVINNLQGIIDGSTKPVPQDDAAATQDSRISKADGILDWSKPAAQLENEVRAYLGWPRSRTELAGIPIVITKAQAAAGDGKAGAILIKDKQLGVYCAEGLLLIDRLIPAGKKEMTAQAFLAGYSLD